MMETPYCWVCHVCKQWYPKDYKGASRWFEKHVWCARPEGYGKPAVGAALPVQAYEDPPDGYSCDVTAMEMLGGVAREEE